MWEKNEARLPIMKPQLCSDFLFLQVGHIQQDHRVNPYELDFLLLQAATLLTNRFTIICYKPMNKSSSSPHKSSNQDMTIGNPTRLILFFAIPMLIGNVFQQLYNIADSVVVGRLVGANALAAIGATGSVSFFFMALCNGIGTGGGIVTSQFFGQKDFNRVRRCIANTGYIMLVFPTLLGIVSYFLAPAFLRLLQTPETIISDALLYVRIMCFGLVFVSIYNYVSAMLRALGDSKTPLYFLIFSCILNTVLDILFVGSFRMAVFGAGIATLISQGISGICCFAYAFRKNPLFRLRREDLQLDRGVIHSTVRLGVPLSLQFSMIAISNMALQRVVNAYGAVAVAAFTTTNRIEMIMHQPYVSLSTALATFVGQNYGAGKKDRMVSGYRRSMTMMAIFTVVMVPVMWIFGRGITAFFVEDLDVISMGTMALRITSIFYPFLGVIYVIRGVLNGMGDAFFSLFNGIVEVIFRSILPMSFVLIPVMGVWGIWWAVGVVWAISGSTAWLRYKWYSNLISHQKL